MSWLAAGGWSLAVVVGLLALALRRRLELTAQAEHEVRGPLTALTLAVEQVRHGRAGPELAGILDAQLERSRAGLADLSAARRGRRAPAASTPVALERLTRHVAAGWTPLVTRAGRRLRLDWEAGEATVTGDRGRLAQALGNLFSNAVEHGDGAVDVRARRVGPAIRIEVANRRRGDDRAGGGTQVQSRAGRAYRRGRRVADRGRGLAIARKAAEQSGGTLELYSGESETTAALELPIEDR